MRKLLLALTVFFTFPLIGLTQTNIWAEFDGIYLQKYDGLIAYGEKNNSRNGSFRPFVGIGLGKSWSIGAMGDFLSYRDREKDVLSIYPIYNPNPTEPGNPEIIAYQTISNQAAKTNEFFSLGMFLRKDAQIGKRTALSFTLYGLKGTGENGIFEVYPEFFYTGFPGWGCANCLSIVAGPIETQFKEETWRFGLDLGFTYELNSWIEIGLKANFLEFRKQILSGYPQITNGYYPPNWFGNFLMNYGSRFDFGSAVAREGVRLSINLRPFSTRKGEAQ